MQRFELPFQKGLTSAAVPHDHWVRTTLDGFGRTIKTEAGDDTSTKSVVDTVYAPCACSPLGKVTKVSQPHLPGATPSWIVYTYDAVGRTLSATAPDGASTTQYAYNANTVTVTDAAGNSKTMTMDGLGNLVQVSEPRPGGGTYTTSYTYDFLDHLTAVSMPRDGATQTRTFNYIDPLTGYPGVLLRSVNNPENGTVSYTYNANQMLATKKDAMGYVLNYDYDGANRLAQVSTSGVSLRNYYYDSNPFDPSFSKFTVGRLAAISYGRPVNISSGARLQFIDMFSYTPAGQVATKRLQLNEAVGWDTPSGLGVESDQTLNFDAGYAYNDEGALAGISYPSTSQDFLDQTPVPGPSFSYSFDKMGRAVGLADDNFKPVVSGVQYGPANELLAVNYFGLTETRAYNNMLQMTSLTVNGPTPNGPIASFVNMQYRFSATQNNGKITSQKDMLSGEEVQYTYDSLQRLIAASTTAASDAVTPGWGESFGYDGFGNLNAKTPTKGSVPALSIVVDPATNRIVGQQLRYDANGNLLSLPGPGGGVASYSVENQLVCVICPQFGVVDSKGTVFGYDAANKRIVKNSSTPYENPNGLEISLYGVDGKQLGTYVTSVGENSDGSLVLTAKPSYLTVYFHGKKVGSGLPGRWGGFAQDRLGSTANTYPYGEEKTPNGFDGWKFATYLRDTKTLLDYADQRYYSSQLGRFMTADPFKASASSLNPTSWNRYSYVLGDPINYNDPRGLECNIVGNTQTANPSGCDVSSNGSADGGDYTLHINVTDPPADGGGSSEKPPPSEPSDEHPSLVPPSLGPFINVNQGGPGGSSGGASSSGLTAKQAACAADAAINGALSIFVPGYAAAKALSSFGGFSFNPVGAVTGMSGLFSGGNPTALQTVAGFTGANSVYQDARFAAAGGASALSRVQDLTSRASFGFQSASGQGRLLSQLGNLESLSGAASFAAKANNIAAGISAGYDIYKCVTTP